MDAIGDYLFASGILRDANNDAVKQRLDFAGVFQQCVSGVGSLANQRSERLPTLA